MKRKSTENNEKIMEGFISPKCITLQGRTPPSVTFSKIRIIRHVRAIVKDWKTIRNLSDNVRNTNRK
jgi:hypothetical protein